MSVICQHVYILELRKFVSILACALRNGNSNLGFSFNVYVFCNCVQEYAE